MADVFCTKPPDLDAWAAVRNGSRRAVLPAAGPGDYCNLKEKFALDLLQIQQPGSQMQIFVAAGGNSGRAAPVLEWGISHYLAHNNSGQDFG
jgi:hypothetical protein